jgi:hypothetical protein
MTWRQVIRMAGARRRCEAGADGVWLIANCVTVLGARRGTGTFFRSIDWLAQRCNEKRQRAAGKMCQSPRRERLPNCESRIQNKSGGTGRSGAERDEKEQGEREDCGSESTWWTYVSRWVPAGLSFGDWNGRSGPNGAGTSCGRSPTEACMASGMRFNGRGRGRGIEAEHSRGQEPSEV